MDSIKNYVNKHITSAKDKIDDMDVKNYVNKHVTSAGDAINDNVKNIKHDAMNFINSDERYSTLYKDGGKLGKDIHSLGSDIIHGTKTPVKSMKSSLKDLGVDAKDYIMNHPGKVGMAAAGTAGLVGAGIAAKKYLSRRKKK